MAQNSGAPRSQEDYITQVSEEIEGRVTKRLSKEFSRTENRILGALARLDDFLMNPLLPGHSGTAPEPTRNTTRNNQGTNEDGSQTDPHPEASLFDGQREQNSGTGNDYDSYISNNFKAAISEYKGVLHCEGYDYEQDPEDISNPLPDPFFTRRMKLLGRPDGFMLYGKLGIDFFSTSELLYPNIKIRLRLIRARPNFYMISDNPNVSLGIADCSLYTRRIALKDDYHKKRMDMLAYAPVEYNYLETLAKTFIIPARQNQFIQENIINNAPIRRIAIAMNTNSAFTGSFTENPF